MYVLHHVPDNASLIVRIVLEEIGAPYRIQPHDRPREQDSAAFRTLSPTGLIPVMETPDGPIFETGAILLWLGERHGALAPCPGNLQRAEFLKWLFFVSGTLHSDLAALFRPERRVGPDPAAQAAHHTHLTARIRHHLALLDAYGMAERPAWLTGTQPSILSYYLAVLLRWAALYPEGGTAWFDIEATPYLQGLAERLERRPAAQRAAEADRLGPTPFSQPALPEG